MELVDSTERVLEGKRVFVVEDDIANMSILLITLKNAGALVIQDHWNSHTLELLERHLPVDIVLLDLMLRHNMSGYDFFAELKSHPGLATIPIVAVSAADPTREIPRAKVLGLSGFICKPIDFHKFPLQVALCIRGENVWVGNFD